MFKAFVATSIALAALAAPAFAQDAASPDGVWKDKWGTTFTFSTCGDAGTQLCGVLNDVQGNSRTEENLAFINQQVVSADQTAPGKWEGQIALNGGNAKAIVEVKDANTLTITGCQGGILCQTLTYNKVS
ncbi:hypothetical protein DevBK_14065 [Devosia sp. BK]|jgi:hypothetical protein|uniref:hypothetical protein n=1 Tax=unclassified Devosia TaxID=196773 RepID=UPI00071624D1|nr:MULTISPECIES: hypothetical protein [unclassified Devosia]KQT48391.1 hypothetical protein ASG47_08555 [Devosia sp. Leaf420]MDV3252461.1 hypothetical protein [Devosia sp. BK]